jgi:hypothetical protein
MLVGLHYLLFVLDVAVFLAYISVELYAATKELIRYVKSFDERVGKSVRH